MTIIYMIILLDKEITNILFQLFSWALSVVWQRLLVAGGLALGGIVILSTATSLGRSLARSWGCGRSGGDA